MTRYFIDTEFQERGPEHPLALISIGIVCEDGRAYYAQDATFDGSIADDWVRSNVLPYLSSKEWKSREQIHRDLHSFFDVKAYGKPELVGWCASYDFVLLCQLFGTMMDLPSGYPHYIKDIQYRLDEHHLPDDRLPPFDGPMHNALADAKHIQAIWAYLETLEKGKQPGDVPTKTARPVLIDILTRKKARPKADLD